MASAAEEKNLKNTFACRVFAVWIVCNTSSHRLRLDSRTGHLSAAAGFTGFAPAADPYCYPVGGSDCKLEAQIAAWKVRLQPGSSDCSLEVQITALRVRLQSAGADGSLEIRLRFKELSELLRYLVPTDNLFFRQTIRIDRL